ncbi:MAG: hypothetical protein ACK2TS_01755 [Anaerolineales bacterium]|jgi:NhaP-type Na+/H+ or K+/H+ antiporter
MGAPETTNYMIAGYAVFVVIFSIFIASLAMRWNRLKKDQQTLQELEKENE